MSESLDQAREMIGSRLAALRAAGEPVLRPQLVAATASDKADEGAAALAAASAPATASSDPGHDLIVAALGDAFTEAGAPRDPAHLAAEILRNATRDLIGAAPAAASGGAIAPMEARAAPAALDADAPSAPDPDDARLPRATKTGAEKRRRAAESDADAAERFDGALSSTEDALAEEAPAEEDPAEEDPILSAGAREPSSEPPPPAPAPSAARAAPQPPEAPAALAPEAAPPDVAAFRAAHLFEAIPRRMRVGRAQTATVRISRSESAGAGMPGAATGAVRRHAIMASRAMTVTLDDPSFAYAVRPLTPATQWVDRAALADFGLADRPAEWRWSVEPLKTGVRPLVIRASARVASGAGESAEASLPEQEIEVRVGVDPARVAGAAARWTLFAVAAGVLGHYSVEIIEAVSAVAAVAAGG